MSPTCNNKSTPPPPKIRCDSCGKLLPDEYISNLVTEIGLENVMRMPDRECESCYYSR